MILPSALLVAIPVVGIGMIGSLVLLARMRRERRVAQRLSGLNATRRRFEDGAKGPPLIAAIAALGSAVSRSGILSAKTIGELEQTLISSGLQGRNGIGLFIGSKLLLFSVLPVLVLLLLPGAGLSTSVVRVAAVGAALLGLLLPDMGYAATIRNT